jgi:uncharacterized protein (TIGR02453 family)
MAFERFGTTTTFLKDLGRNNSRNNSKEWFHDHYDAYQENLLEPAMAFVEAIGPLLRRFAPDTQAVPKIGASVMRINRDIRFAKDKRPYKDHLDLWFWRGGEKKGPNGYWFRLTPETLVLGGGMHALDKPDLERYREAVDDAGTGTDLARVVTKLERAGYGIGGERYKRVPSGYRRIILGPRCSAATVSTRVAICPCRRRRRPPGSPRSARRSSGRSRRSSTGSPASSANG